MKENYDVYRKFGYALESFDNSLKYVKYPGAFEPREPSSVLRLLVSGLPNGGVTLDQISNILVGEAVSAPHGNDLFQIIPPPKLPTAPDRPTIPPGQYLIWTLEKANKLEEKLAELKQTFEEQFKSEAEAINNIRARCVLNEPDAIAQLMDLSLNRHPIPKILRGKSQFSLDFASRILLVTLEIPDFNLIVIVKKGGSSWKTRWKPVSNVERKRSLEVILYSLIIRAGYLIANSDIGNWFDTIAINGNQHWSDPATGAPREGVIASLQALKSELVNLQIDRLDPKACFRHLKGISTPSIEFIAPVRPIFVMDKDDNRIVGNKDIADHMEETANLAAMEWEDFEHLVRQLFEWEFGRNGIEVKVTRASRDRGVDAIMYDPDPLRGGKYVLQAKRYTRIVDVAAVRDLYGTILNEGANRGILVTTSSYGPDSYEFAKDKPISLVDGPNLIAMLQKHGRKYRIDLLEARAIEKEKASRGMND